MIKYLTYQKKKLPIRVSYFALKMVKEETGKSLTSFTDDDFEMMELLLFYSLKKGCQMTSQEFKYKKEDMEEIMDEVFFDFVAMIPDFFPKSKIPFADGKKK